MPSEVITLQPRTPRNATPTRPLLLQQYPAPPRKESSNSGLQHAKKYTLRPCRKIRIPKARKLHDNQPPGKIMDKTHASPASSCMFNRPHIHAIRKTELAPFPLSLKKAKNDKHPGGSPVPLPVRFSLLPIRMSCRSFWKTKSLRDWKSQGLPEHESRKILRLNQSRATSKERNVLQIKCQHRKASKFFSNHMPVVLSKASHKAFPCPWPCLFFPPVVSSPALCP